MLGEARVLQRVRYWLEMVMAVSIVACAAVIMIPIVLTGLAMRLCLTPAFWRGCGCIGTAPFVWLFQLLRCAVRRLRHLHDRRRSIVRVQHARWMKGLCVLLLVLTR